MALSDAFADIKKSGVDGRGLFAQKNLEGGELIFKKSRPLVAALDVPRLEDTCANCFRSKLGEGVYASGASLEIKKCTGCRMVAYCGKPCQSEHWKRCHKSVCKILKDALEKVPYLKENPHTVSNVTFALLEMVQMRDKLTLSEADWIAVLQLKSHAKEMKAKDPKRFEEAEIIAERALIHLGHPADYSKDFMTQVACAMLTNSLTLVAPTCDPLGLVFDPFACLANHSCEPNAYVMMNGTELSFRSLKDISKDEEIFVSYIDSTEAYNIRQTQLSKRFYFTCKCPKCELGPTLPQDVFLTPSPEVQQTMKHAVDGMRQEIPDTISMMRKRLGLQNSAISYSDLIDCYARNDLMLANELDLPHLKTSLERNPTTRLEMLHRVLWQCQKSGQYTLTRQPYAAARNEYILECIARADFETAWAHAVRSYVEIDPILYPEPHNPLRVVHTFRLAKLSTFLASEPHDKIQNIMDQCVEANLNMPVLAWNCMKEAALQVDKSHGPLSPFTLTVKSAFKAALDEVQSMAPGALEQLEQQGVSLHPALKKISASLPF